MHTGRGSKMCRGSGMGLVHSSAVCDAALFFLAELTWATKVEVQQAFLPYMFIIVFNMTFGFWQGTVLLPGVVSVVSGT